MTKRKLLGLLLAATMIAGVFIGCSGNQSVSSQPQSGTSKIQDQPVEKKQLSLITAPASAPFPDGVTVDNSDILQFIEAKTGYDLEWKIFKTGEPIEQQANMLLVSNDAPDLIQMDPSPSIAGYARDGGLADLTDAFEKNGGTLKEIYTDEILKTGTIDGKLYALSRYTGGFPVGCIAVRTDWLEELGLEVPKTLDDYYNCLKAVKAAKPDVIPLVIDGKFERLTDFMGAFGIYSNRSANFLIEDGKAVFPLLTDRGKEFIQYMNRLYTEGLVSPEFLVDKEAMQKMISGNGFMMSMNWVENVRQMDAFHEKNPGGKLEYIAPPVGKNGEQGHLSQTLVNTTWIVPKTSEDKAYDCVAFLEKCNADEEIVNRICLGEEGVHYQKDGGEIKTLPAFADITYKGYYSRVILDSKWDDYANKLEGFDDPIAFAEQYKKTNEIFYAPFDIPASGSSNAQLQQTILDGVMEMIVKGYSDEKFEELKAKFDAENGNKILEEYQEWYDAQS